MLEIRRVSSRRRAAAARPPDRAWPMIVLRSPKGWTGPKEVDGHKVEGFWRAHQVPLAGMHGNPAHMQQLDDWLRSYKPEELFDATGRLRPELKALAPQGTRRMSANPHANGGVLRRSLRMPDFRDYAIAVDKPGQATAENTSAPGSLPARYYAREHAELPRPEPRRERLKSPRCGLRGEQEAVAGRLSCPRTPTAASWRPTVGSWRCSQNTPWRAGWKATCSPAATVSSPPTKPSSTSSTPCSTCTPSGSP